jgi:CheY-like chemotaxis protein
LPRSSRPTGPRALRSVSVLLVEDDEPKRAHIERFLLQLDPTISITVAKSVNTAIDALEQRRPDLLLIDMSLPTFDIGERESGGRPQGFGGIEILRYMALSEIRCPTIVITGYEAFVREAGKRLDLSQMRSELEKEFPELLRGVLHYNSTYDEWKTKLAAALNEFEIFTGETD